MAVLHRCGVIGVNLQPVVVEQGSRRRHSSGRVGGEGGGEVRSDGHGSVHCHVLSGEREWVRRLPWWGRLHSIELIQCGQCCHLARTERVVIDAEGIQRHLSWRVTPVRASDVRVGTVDGQRQRRIEQSSDRHAIHIDCVGGIGVGDRVGIQHDDGNVVPLVEHRVEERQLRHSRASKGQERSSSLVVVLHLEAALQ